MAAPRLGRQCVTLVGSALAELSAGAASRALVRIATALNVSYMAEKTATFGIVVGIALLLAGLGFAILAVGGALRNPELGLGLSRREASDGETTPVPVA